MAFKLSKTEQAELRKLIDRVEDATGELAQWLDTLADEWRGEFDEKSEKWQEGEAGASVQERIDTIEAWRDQLTDCEIDPGELA